MEFSGSPHKDTETNICASVCGRLWSCVGECVCVPPVFVSVCLMCAAKQACAV